MAAAQLAVLVVVVVVMTVVVVDHSIVAALPHQWPGATWLDSGCGAAVSLAWNVAWQ